ncbi:hypothetical protein [Nonomuraea dietziae]
MVARERPRRPGTARPVRRRRTEDVEETEEEPARPTRRRASATRK